MKIRKAHEQDVKDIAILLCELGYSGMDEDKIRETLIEILHSKTMGILVAESAGESVGFASFSWKPQLRLGGWSMELDELVVSSQARGRGVGQQLLKAVIEKACKQGIQRVILSTNRKRESYTRKFYEKQGFLEKDSAWLCLEFKK